MPTSLLNRRVRLLVSEKPRGTGWLPPYIDPRDYTPAHPGLNKVNKRLEEKLAKHDPKALDAPPPSVDLRPWCSQIEDQGQIGSCTAHAAVGIVEYFQRRSFGKHLDGSRLFVYKTTRNLLGLTGDTGAWLRNAMGALVTCGIPNESFWPYTDANPAFDEEPTQFVYAIADNFETLKYFAHDPLKAFVPPANVVKSVKEYLVKGVPSMFGFWGYTSFDSGDQPGHIPIPTAVELGNDADWGHAIVAVGYDDKRKITNTISNKTTTGAFLIRNSWGTTWGQGGYGWMPYDYVVKGIAMDFWSLLGMEWVDTDRFLS